MDERLVVWIGGGPGAGKTTVARRLARRFGLRWYNGDAQTWVHRDRAIRSGNVAAQRFEEFTPAQRWKRPLPELMAMALHDERGPMIAADVAALSPGPPVVAEGTPIVPSMTGDWANAVWIVTPPPVRRRRLEQRGVEGAMLNLYLALADTVDATVAEADAPVIVNDDDSTIDGLIAAVAERFAHVLPFGATDRTQRAELLRASNQAIVDQVRGFFARPWAVGNAETQRATLDCECGGAECLDTVDVVIGELSDVPLISDDHGV
ncbi:AAA family ATPase [Stackebrandtia soli]|uniref:AAA family ATPase n=1 Tax=Stackebrandtia soli TaxID=1892856 RepID=UPI0039EBCEF4